MNAMFLGLPDWSGVTDVYLLVGIPLLAITLAAARHCPNPVAKARKRGAAR